MLRHPHRRTQSRGERPMNNMTHIEDYALANNLSRRWVERLISKGQIRSEKINGKTYILNTQSHELTSAQKNELLKQFKQDIKSKVLKQKHSVIPECLIAIENFEKKYKITAKGLSEKTLYALASGSRLPERRNREDKGQYRNKILQSSYSKIIDLAEYFFFAPARKNYLLTCDMVTMHAKNNEDFWEIASVPRDTLYRFLRLEGKARGWDETHDYKNHYNNWNQQRASVTGAFTDQPFFKFIAGDDHSMDVFKALQWSPLKKALEGKTIYSWFWSEPKTQKILSFVIKPTALKASDLIDSLLEALMQVGKPSEGILIDNGIGNSNEFTSFCNKLQLPVTFGKPYEPKDKATMERIFKYIKEEHDVFFNNFTGSHHSVEGRHPWKSLTPEKADYTFEHFEQSLRSYIFTFYEQRLRNKTVDGQKMKVSIAELFENFSKDRFPEYWSDQALRFAYMRDEEKPRKFRNYIIFRNEQYLPKDYLSPVLNRFKYRVAYNPNDLSKVDLYATELIQCKITGIYFQPGDYVMTCYATRHIENKHAEVARYNAQRSKLIKALAKEQINVEAANNPYLQNKLASTVNIDGQIKETRKLVEKRVTKALEAELPKTNVSEIIEAVASEDTEILDLDNDVIFTYKSKQKTEDIFDINPEDYLQSKNINQ